MAWPTIFANLAGGNQPLSLFDAMFNQVAQMVAIPSTAAGANAISLTPIGSAPTLTAYQNFSSFRFLAAANSTALVTAGFSGLAVLPVYLNDGATQAGSGAIISGEEYVLVFAQSLNAGGGGFFLEQAAIPALATAPQTFVAGPGASGTYNTPAGAAWLEVELVGGGGGGAGSGAGAGNGGTGQTGTFGTSFLTAPGGIGGTGAGPGGLPGVGAGGTYNAAGGQGGAAVSGALAPGGAGGVSYYGGGAGASLLANAGGGGQAPGSGGAGGSGSSSTNFSAAGGGAGGFTRAIIANPLATYAYQNAGFGAAGTAGTSGFAGGPGQIGSLLVIAHFR